MEGFKQNRDMTQCGNGQDHSAFCVENRLEEACRGKADPGEEAIALGQVRGKCRPDKGCDRGDGARGHLQGRQQICCSIS